jgi:superfamily I DNA and/or RNA helicase
VKLIKDLVCPWLRKIGLKGNDIEVNTVDGFQGREKEIIIFSCVRSNDSQSLGFLTDERRMNVAITRAKEYLFVFGNAATLSSNSVWTSFMNQSA